MNGTTNSTPSSPPSEPSATRTPRAGDWWIVRLEGGCLSQLAQVAEAPDSYGVVLHLAGMHRDGEKQRYPLAKVEFVRVAPLYVTPQDVPDPG